MRSGEVVLPASICAMMPMLRVSASCALRAMSGLPRLSPLSLQNHPLPLMPGLKKTQQAAEMTGAQLPAIVRKRLVGFRHAMHVFLLLHRAAACVGGIHQLLCQLVSHGLARARARVKQQPANRKRLPAEWIHFD